MFPKGKGGTGYKQEQNKTKQKPQKSTEQTDQSVLFLLVLIRFSFSSPFMDDLPLRAVWEDWYTDVTKGCELLQSFLLPLFSETGSLSKGNMRRMGLSSFNDAKNNKVNMF